MLAPDLQDLPDEVLEAMGETTPVQSAEILNSLAITIASLRKEAVDERRASGIEEVWLSAEEAYIGIDDANRSEFEGAGWAKPMAMNAPLTSSTSKRNEVRSTAYVRLTARYVDAGAAKLSEIALPMDGHAFSINSTLDPDMVIKADDMTPATIKGAQVMTQETSGQSSAPATVSDVAQHDMTVATTKADKAEDRILSWLQQAKFRAEMRKVIADASRIGTGVLKGPFPIQRTHSAAREGENGYEIEVIESVYPGVKWVDPWNCYPDASCGDDVHNGEYFFELEQMSRKKVRELRKDKTYLKAQIDAVLEEGPDSEAKDSRNPNDKQSMKDKRFKVWYFYGTIKQSELNSASNNPSDSKKNDDVFVIVTMINSTIVKATVNPSPSGKLPYRVMPWQRRAGSWAGIGVAEQVSMPQRAVNGAARAMFDNAGISAGIQVVLDRGSIEPADGKWDIGRNKIWYQTADATADDVRKAFITFEIPSLQGPLMNIIEWGMKQAEESSSIPLVTQGFSGTSTPDTFGAAQLQNNNANQLLRDIGHRLDDCITEPLICEYYDYLLLDPDVPDSEKGSFDIDAHGTAALVERYIQSQEMMQFLELSLNPAFGLDPKLTMQEILKSKHFNPVKFQLTDEKITQMEKQPPQAAPAVQAAQVRAQAQVKIAQDNAQSDQAIQQARNQTQLQIEQGRTNKDAEAQQAIQSRNQSQAQIAEQKLALMRDAADLNERIALLDASTKKGVSLDQMKADLAQTSAKLQTEERLATAALVHGAHAQQHQVMPPPVQVPGKAPDGHAFEQV